ncbi:Glutamyl endopeptidase [Colletotrichum shisoi]|uniref:Serine protease n=1 Tax=Colletotrichum shisoi TaxID=2078593 RepID=A0A5Q4BEL6_9PEZI|nr:Glutamyl endopeptidase [Colletotrichum shisoi]
MSQAGIWTLHSAVQEEGIESSYVEVSGEHGGVGTQESIIGVDRRHLALPGDFMDGGRYRSVVKIKTRFGDVDKGTSVWMMGTGWLIRPNLLVTAGHVVYDWSRGLGEAREIRCYIGYSGAASVGKPHVQTRSATKIVTTAEWLSTKADRTRAKDVAFIQVDRDFEGNLSLFKFSINTPVAGRGSNLGVIGYPGDKSLRNEDTGENEMGAEMYEAFQDTDYDIAKSQRNMIEYKISTYGGQSGAPIVRRGDMMVIGTHCYGGGGFESNSGNSIGGQFGNVYSKYIDLFVQPLDAPNGKAAIVTLGHAGSANGQAAPRSQAINNGQVAKSQIANDQVGNGQVGNGLALINKNSYNYNYNSNSVSGPPVGDAEGFLDILRAVGKVGSVALPIAGSILGGPIGGGIATVAGSLLSLVSGAESALDNGASSPESFAPHQLSRGAAERAVLAEAALQTIVSLDRGDVAEGLIDDVVSTFKRTAPKLEDLVKVLRPILTQQALEIAVKGMNRTAGLAQTSLESDLSRARVSIHTGGDVTESALTGAGEGAALLESLLTPTVPVGGEEGWISSLGSLISTGVKWAAPIAGNLAKEYAPKIIGGLVRKISGGSQESVEGSDVMLNDDTTRFLLKRALLADASLTALQRLNKNELNQLRIRSEVRQEHALGDQEGAWGDFFKTVVQKVAPIALDGAKKAAAALAPKIVDAALGKLGRKESELSVPNANGARTLKTKGSYYDVLNGRSPIQVSSFLTLRETGGQPPSTSPATGLTQPRRLSGRRSSLDSNPDLPVAYPAAPF